MVRSYLPDPIDEETIERIVGTSCGGLRAAASARAIASSSSPTPETRRELARLAGEDEYVAMGMPPWISVAPVHIVVGVREASYHERYSKADKLVDGEEITWPAPTGTSTRARSSCCSSSPPSTRGSAPGSTASPGEDVPELKALLGMPDDVHFVCVDHDRQAARRRGRAARSSRA